MNRTGLPKLYKFFVVIIFIVSQGTNSIEANIYSDSIPSANTSDFYEYSSLVFSRYRRDNNNTNENCEIPNNPPNSAYQIITEPGATYKPGDYVKKYSILEITCDEGYKLPPFTQNTSVCLNGQWGNLPQSCLRVCPSLMSTKSMTVKCKYNGTIPLDNCVHPVQGTTVRLSCNTFYEADAAIRRNRNRACRNGEWTPNLPECYATCGLKSPQAQFNIYNGRNATRGDYPWHVGIYTNTNEFRCGGSIIDHNIVLSAAHCFSDYNGNVYPAENYLIAAGKYYREYHDDRDEFAQYSAVREIFVPEQYRSINGLNGFDIAVVILEDSFTLTVGVQPVCIQLEDEYEDTNYLINNNGIVTGWGYTQDNQVLSDVLKELIIPYIPYDTCYNQVPTNFRKFLTPDKICGGYLNQSTSVCQGDSGGSLVYNINDHYYVKGVVSTSPSSTDSGVLQCNSQQYGLYTSVQYHTNFLTTLVTNYGWKQSIQCARDDCANEDTENRDSCRLPNIPQHGKYSFPDNNTKYEPGNYVHIHNVVFLSCDAGYEANPSGVTQFYCLGKEQWIPSVGTCKLIVPSRNESESLIPILETTTKPSEEKILPTTNIIGQVIVPSRNKSESLILILEITTKPSQKEILPTTNIIGQVYQHPLLPKPDECGLDFTSSEIMIGEEIGVKELPWTALLSYTKFGGSEMYFGCGGSLINKRYVLTAAECVKLPIFQTLNSVRLGEYNILTDIDCKDRGKMRYCNDAAIDYEIESFVTHEDYSEKNKDNNIALIRLNRDVEFTFHIQPICLPTESADRDNLVGINMTIAGWEQTPIGLKLHNSDVKLKANFVVIPQNECIASASLNVVHLTDKQYCAMVICKNTICDDICVGGVGASFVRQLSKTPPLQWVQEGITSNILCNPYYPGIYTRVSKYVKWIVEHMID